jgi:hypothetical protein
MTPLPNENTTSANPSDVSEIIVEFDNQQVQVVTDVPEIASAVSSAFVHMLAPFMTVSAGKIELRRLERGYEMRSFETLHYGPSDLEFLPDIVTNEVRIQFMRARPDLLWMHAAAVERDGLALLISGASGQGKSTLSTHLCTKGWHLLSDDVAPTSMRSDTVIPFPQEPKRRVFPGRMVHPSRLRSLEREVISMDPDMLRRDPAQICAVIYAHFQIDSHADLSPLSAGESALELLRNALNFVDHKEAAVARAAEVARRIPGFSLKYSSAETASALLNSYVFGS